MACPRVSLVVNRGCAAHLHIDVNALDAIGSVVEVSGELDLATAGRLTDALHQQLAINRRFTVLDVAGLTFCDATGLGVLLRAHQEYRAAEGRLTLSGVGPRLAQLLRITALDEILNVTAVEPPRTAALRSEERI